MASNASVEQLVACGLGEIGLQLEFQRLIRETTQQNVVGNDSCTEILTSSSSGSIHNVRTTKPSKSFEKYVRAGPKDLQSKVSNLPCVN